jgi:SpoVK/Ycf46/Vps4 family AAA+-type ATPase
MTVDPEVLAALEASVAADPDKVGVRVHLATLLLQAGRVADALVHAAEVVRRDPANSDALALLAGAQDALDRDAPVDPEAAEQLDEYDRFLREVTSGVEVERASVTLDDVGGLDDVKRRITTSFLAPLRNPELRATYGASLRGGLLLYGPPGCGKTYLARAIAGEMGAGFLAVGLHEVLDMWLGQSERNVHEVFETARAAAPCVLFLDEVDALGQSRNHRRRSSGRNIVVQLLEELDGLRSDNEGVYVLAATNQVWDLDPALRRPGRFDRTILVLPPDEAAREVIFRVHLAHRPAAGVDLRRLAKRTEGYSGADIRLVCEAAAHRALEQAVTTGQPEPITTSDLLRAATDVKPSTRRWFEVAANYATFANQDGEYDELLAYMRRRRLP